MARRGRGFTLIEMLGVMVIIGVLAIFILAAGSAAMQEANQASTRALITKLDAGMTQFLELIQNTRTTPTVTHQTWATLFPTNGQAYASTGRDIAQRAQVLANYDHIRGEIPDGWFVQDATLSGTGYPINFAQQPFLATGTIYDWMLPIGVNAPANIGAGTRTPGEGIYGAHYTAAAGLYKNLGNVPAFVLSGAVPTPLMPQGYDGSDNDGGSSDPSYLIDNINEGIQGTANIQASVAASLAQHKHRTARSEMLYALLVEGRGPFGAIFNRSDFTDKEVRDTDNDGLPEFVDAWGEPLQFFRWPVFYHSDVQRGIPTVQTTNPAVPYAASLPYAGMMDTREQDGYDPNQQLTAVSWWSNTQNMGPGGVSGSPMAAGFSPPGNFLSGAAIDFQRYFHWINEPMNALGVTPQNVGFYWSRSGNFYQRRPFYTRFLILSGGPDKVLGVPIIPDDQMPKPSTGSAMSVGQIQTTALWIQMEGQAAQFDLIGTRFANPSFEQAFAGAPSPFDMMTGDTFFSQGMDDITNHNLNSSSLAAQ